MFGSYQPTVVSTPEGRQSRRPSVRFSTEDVSALEKKTKASTPTRQRGSADWLGLKANDDDAAQRDAAESDPEMASPSLPPERRASISELAAADPPSAADNDLVQAATAEVSVSQKQNEEDDWLSGALSRKRALSASRPEAATPMPTREETAGPTERPGLDRSANKALSSHDLRIREDAVLAVREISRTSCSDSGPAALSTPIREPTMKRASPSSLTSTEEVQSTPAPPQQPQLLSQITFSVDGLQTLKQQQPLVDHQPLQDRMVRLEGQIKVLQLERDQSQMLMENIQLRHKQDMELMENAHK